MEYTIVYCDYGSRARRSAVMEDVHDEHEALDLFLDMYEEYYPAVAHVVGIYPIAHFMEEGMDIGVNIGAMLEEYYDEMDADEDIYFGDEDDDDEYFDDDDDEYLEEEDIADLIKEILYDITPLFNTGIFKQIIAVDEDLILDMIGMHIAEISLFDVPEMVEELEDDGFLGFMILEMAKEIIDDGGIGSLLELVIYLAEAEN